MLTAPGERRIVVGGEVEAHHPEQCVPESFGLAQREMVDESQGQGGLDGEPSSSRCPRRCASGGASSAIASEDNPRHDTPRRRGPDCTRSLLRLVRALHLRGVARGDEKGGPRRPTRSGYSCNNAARPTKRIVAERHPRRPSRPLKLRCVLRDSREIMIVGSSAATARSTMQVSLRLINDHQRGWSM